MRQPGTGDRYILTLKNTMVIDVGIASDVLMGERNVDFSPFLKIVGAMQEGKWVELPPRLIRIPDENIFASAFLPFED